MFLDISSLFLPPLPSPIQITSMALANFKINLNFNHIQNPVKSPSSCSSSRSCLCGRRPFLATISTSLIPLHPSIASDSISDDPVAVMNRFHPPRPDWYEEFYAVAMDASINSYEAEIAGYKSQIFANLTGKAANILEIGIGTGPNLKYYGNSGVSVIGVDPNRKMEQYAQAAAQASGLPPKNFKFIHAVAEALPVSDASMDAVVGTLVLCSVSDVNKTLQEVKRVLKPGGLYIFVEHVAAKDGTILKVIQRALDPLQQAVADGCHLTRETGDSISAAGFSSTDIKKIAKTGSLCCVAARPHGSNAVSQDWSMGPHEPYWRTNTSFSPPPPRWDFRFQNEGQSFGSQEGNRLYGSSTSSNSRGSRTWFRGNYLPHHRHSTSDGFGAFFSSPSEFSPAQQWTPTVQEISLDEYATSSKRVLGPLSFSPTSEGLSAPHDGGASISSNSDSSDYEPIAKSQSSQHNFATRGCFMSKPVHPLAFPNHPRFQDPDDSTLHSDLDFSDVSEPVDPDSLNRPNSHKCNLCERFLSQRSPWSSRQIIRSGDMPVTGVLSCRHVFHAECLDQTTPKTQNGDPPCPICAKSETKYSPDRRASSKLKSGFPRVRPFREDGPSRPWGCVQAGSCVEGALSAQPSHNAMLILNRNRVKKSLSLKKSGTGSSQSGGSDGVGCSKSASSSRRKL